MTEITDLAPEHIPEAMEISKKEFGIDYLSEEEFLEFISDENVFCKVALDNGHVMGFCECVVFGPENVDEILKLPECEERDMMLSFGKIGLIDGIAIRSDGQGHGYGTQLMNFCMKEFERRETECVCAMAWKSIRGTTNVKKLLERYDLKESIAIQGYWNKMVSSPEGHHCPHCDPPCKCWGVLYYRTFSETL